MITEYLNIIIMKQMSNETETMYKSKNRLKRWGQINAGNNLFFS